MPWRAHHQAQEDVRALRDEGSRSAAHLLETALRKRLSRLREARRTVDAQAPFKLNAERNNAKRRVEIALAGRFIQLCGAPDLEDGAQLSIWAVLEQRPSRLLQYTIAIEGVTSRGGAPWVIHVHLDPERRGAGACGHALIHCHVGPDLKQQPKARVPFPPVGPAEALDWALTQLYEDWEPAPWAP